MKILGIESAALVASVALIDDEKVIAEYTLDYKKTHSQTLLPMLAELERMTEMDFSDVDAIAVAAGPGSFTGLRIGAATAKGLGMAWSKPLAAVPTLDAMALSGWGFDGLVCPVMDAKRSQAYTALYRFTKDGRMEQLLDSRASDMGEWLELLTAYAQPVLFTGDGIPVFRKQIEEKLGDKAFIAPPFISRQRAALVAAAGLKMLKEGKTVDAASFAPEYLRLSQAERERSARVNTTMPC